MLKRIFVFCRIKDLEDTNKLLESSRLEQTSRDLELEEKLSILKEDRDRLTKDNVRLQSLLDSTDKEKGELEQSIKEKLESQFKEEIESAVSKTKGEYEEKITKMKKQVAAKLKAVKEQNASESAVGFFKILT